jgi:hypothetical protein
MAKTSAERTRDHRRRLRAQGLRRREIWVYDMHDPQVRERIERQLAALARLPLDPEIEALLDANLAEIEGWTA